ncbi:nicotinamide-nucleotide amidase [Hafnia alvei]|uniref:nicotinamide-nucleotide amidase n=1 Tax=Hafnia alvei TaxID=569 RepID=UPI0024A92C45|nr:nicotinamide-nucleotide amidase [Hafnia alvei]
MTDDVLLELSATLGARLKEKGTTLTCAESCTGGLIAKVITDISGSSAYFERGYVTYSNQAKHEMLGVTLESLRLYGAVSEAVVNEMAQGALRAASADFAVSVSGIAGPDGGSAAKPAGTVWFGFAAKDGRTYSIRQYFPGGRLQVRQLAAEFALCVLIEKFL